MGHEILYCSGCQSQLRGPDFEKGAAFHYGQGSWCAKCAPAEARVRQPALPTITPRRGSRAEKKTARSQAAADANRTALLFVGAGVLIVGLVVLAVALGSGNSAPTPAPVLSEPREARRVEGAAKPKPASNLEAIVRDLENQLAAGTPPSILLARCEETAPLLKGTPHEPRLRAVETEARKRQAAETDRKVDTTLAEARTILASPFVRDREAEVRSMLKAALGLSASRRADVDRALAELDAALAKPPPAPVPSSAPLPGGAAAGKPAAESGPEIVRLYLADLKTGKAIPGFNPFPEGGVVDLARFPADQVDIRAELRGPAAKSVRFEVQGLDPRIESFAPYDAGGSKPGPRDWAAQPGPKVLTATPFPKGGATGPPGKPVILRFTVKAP